MYYSKPVFGRAFKPFSNQMVDVTSDTVDQWSFKKLVRWRRNEFALFTNSKGEEIMQSLRAIRYVRLRPGEDNYNSKLTNAQGLEVFQRAIKGDPIKDIAKDFDISPHTVSDIKNLRARTKVTLDFLNGNTKKAEPAKVIVAKRQKGKKLSESMARFIHTDHNNQKMNVKQLAKKYCVSERTIQRILKGDMYSGSKV